MKSLMDIGMQKIISVAAQSGGRYGWCAATKMRWKQFCKYCDSVGVYSTSQISHDTLKEYADSRCKDLAVSTAQNYISSVNSVIKLINQNWISCSPRNSIGRSRKFVRVQPLLFTAEDIHSAAFDLENMKCIDLSLLVQVSAEFGLRRREVALLDIPNAIKEARKLGEIDIQRGTKGGRGRYVERWVPCGEDGLKLLERAKNFIEGARCLVPSENSLKNFYDRISNICLPVLKRNGIGKLHNLRVFYACRRYREITGCVAPCNRVVGDLIATHELDERARKIISIELGHSRIQIVSSYIGRKVRRSGSSE